MSAIGFAEVAEQLRRVTVVVETQNHGGGSGIVWSSNGTIVTNAHVVRGTRARVQLPDGREFEAKVVARDARRDVAALQIAASGLHAAVIADSSKVRPGELAIAIGNPLGFVGALTTGVIHAIGPIREIGGRTSGPVWVQAGVRLAPGNSGGPLADARGRVIGVNTMTVAGRLALAVPSNAVRNFLAAGAPDAWLGVTVQAVRVPREVATGHRGKFGLLLLQVEEGSPAALASLMAGDILLSTEIGAFGGVEDLSRALQGSGPRALQFEFLRGDYRNLRRVTVRLGSQVARGSGIAASCECF